MKLEEMTKDQLVDLARKQEAEMLAARQPLADSFVAPGVTVDSPKATAYLKIEGDDWEYNTEDHFSGARTGGIPLVALPEALAHTARAVAAARLAKENAAEQAQQHAMEAKAQRGTVLDILRHFGCAEEDWNALTLVKAAHEREVQEAVARAVQPVAGELPPLPKWIDDQKGKDPLMDDIIAYLEGHPVRPVQQSAAVETIGKHKPFESAAKALHQDWTPEKVHHLINVVDAYVSAHAAKEPSSGVPECGTALIARIKRYRELFGCTLKDAKDICDAGRDLSADQSSFLKPAAGVQPSSADSVMLQELLARIHRDGGHHSAKVGTEQSVKDADLIVAKLLAAGVQGDAWRGCIAQIVVDTPLPERNDKYQSGFVDAKEAILSRLREAGYLNAKPQPDSGRDAALENATKEELWAEIWRLRYDGKGPDGFGTWKEAAVAERIRRVKAEQALAAHPANGAQAGQDPHWIDSPQSALGGKTAREGYAANPDYSGAQVGLSDEQINEIGDNWDSDRTARNFRQFHPDRFVFCVRAILAAAKKGGA